MNAFGLPLQFYKLLKKDFSLLKTIHLSFREGSTCRHDYHWSIHHYLLLSNDDGNCINGKCDLIDNLLCLGQDIVLHW